MLFRHFTPRHYIKLPDTLSNKSVKDELGESFGIMKLGHFVHKENDPGVMTVRKYADEHMSAAENPPFRLGSAAAAERCRDVPTLQ